MKIDEAHFLAIHNKAPVRFEPLLYHPKEISSPLNSSKEAGPVQLGDRKSQMFCPSRWPWR